MEAGMAGNVDAQALALLRDLSRADGGWAVVCTTRGDGTVQASVVTAGVADHPVTGATSVAFVCRGDALKLLNFRRIPRSTIVFRNGGRWVTVEGDVSIIGPDDPEEGFDLAGLPKLLRDVFTAAGGTHDNWPTYDRVMADERRAAVYISLDRVYSNPSR
jgi:PPOX class probable F420-dependent enzyme